MTGVNFDRPGWKKLLKDVEHNLVNCIIVKDLSRLGRNYIDVGEYLERTFPIKGIRVIALLDAYDSLTKGSVDIETSFMNLVNTAMPYDTSVKTHVSLDQKMKNGEAGSKVPYGYIKDGTKMVIDPEKAEIVRKIFNLASDGKRVSEIIDELAERKINSPTGKERWNAVAIKYMLRNRSYVGEHHPGKVRMEMRVKKSVAEEDRVHFIDHHESIVDPDIFEKVQTILDEREKKRAADADKELVREEDPLRGLTKCVLCGASLKFVRKSSKTRVITSKYYCPNHTGDKATGKKLKKRPEIEAEAMKAEVVRQCNEMIDKLEHTKVRYEIEDGLAVTGDIKTKEKELEQRRYDLGAQLTVAFEKKYNGEISEEEYRKQADLILEEIESIKERVESLQSMKYQQTLMETARKKTLSQNKKMEEFDEDTVRRMVAAVYLEDNGKVNVDFKLDLDLEELIDRGFKMS